MLSESFRPTTLDEIIGHTEVKAALVSYLNGNPRSQGVLISGTPGIGKTTLVLAAARSCMYEPLEINASRSLRSHEDVSKLRDSCRAPITFTSLANYTNPRKTCVILDEVDGSDPHAQRKILEWIKDPERNVPILCTANEIPVIFKRASDALLLHRCMPLSSTVLYDALRDRIKLPFESFQHLVKECQHDVRRILHRSQYGLSDSARIVTMTGDPITDLLRHQEMFYKKDPITRALESTGT
jgi:replication factor C subunit 1